MGLGSVTENNGLYLSIAGGYIWNRKADSNDPDYAEQTFKRGDGTEGVRAGARYSSLTGTISNVTFKTHDEYGESINVTIDSDGKIYIISISTNNRYSQDLMKALLKMDLNKPIFLKPYDFVGTDKKRAMGISFRQDGIKLGLRVDGAPSKEKEWFKSASKKHIKRYFEDLSEWYVEEVTEKIIPQLGTAEASDPATDEDQPDSTAVAKEVKKPVEKAAKAPSVVAMKKAIRAYIAENYEGQTLPKLSKEEVTQWYELVQSEDELPLGQDAPNAEVSEESLDEQLDKLGDL